MLLCCRDLCGILATLHAATLQRSLWYPCYVTCCYAAEISVVSLLRYMLLRCRDLWYPCYVACCYAAKLWRMSSAAAPPSNAIQARLMLRGPAANNSSPTLWVPGTKMSCYMPNCGNGDSSTSTRNCLRRLQRCCERSSEKDAWIGRMEIAKKITFYCSENTISPKNTQIWTSKFATFQVTQMVASLWQNTHFVVKLHFHEHGFRSGGMF